MFYAMVNESLGKAGDKGRDKGGNRGGDGRDNDVSETTHQRQLMLWVTWAIAWALVSILSGGCTTSTAQGNSPSSPSGSPTAMPSPNLGQSLPITAHAILNGQRIELEVARTAAQQALGLMYRPPLGDNQGMLFPFAPARPVSFWMKNVPVPLDMVFLYQGRVVKIAEAVPPCQQTPCPTYGPSGFVNIDGVIELRAGRARELGLKVEDSVTLEFLP
jgi:uncharacterized protein